MKVRFYLTSSGRSPIEDFLKTLSQSTKEEFIDAVNLLAQGKVLAMPLSRNLSSIMPGLHAFRKKSNEIPQKEIEIIVKRIKEI